MQPVTRVVVFGGTRYVCDVIVGDRSVTVLVPLALRRIAGMLAWRVGEEQGWIMGGGSAFSVGTGHADSLNEDNGRVSATEWRRA